MIGGAEEILKDRFLCASRASSWREHPSRPKILHIPHIGAVISIAKRVALRYNNRVLKSCSKRRSDHPRRRFSFISMILDLSKYFQPHFIFKLD